LYGRKEGDGGRAENEARMLDLIDLTYDLFVSRPRLELNGAGVTNVTGFEITGDSGIIIAPYPTGAEEDASFYVVDFTAIVTYRSVCT
jgi:hypothetical protein